METEVIEVRVMAKDKALALDAEIVAFNDDWFRNVAPLMTEMRNGSGYKALGYSTFRDYCASVDERLGYKMAVYRLVDRIDVESNIGVPLAAESAYALAKLPSPEAQREVFKSAMDEYAKPLARNFKTLIDRWFKKHDKKRAGGKSERDGWSKADLEDDGELATALDRIEGVYGHNDRKALQDGSIGLSRKDIIGLAAFHVTKMKEVQLLIMAKHWDLATSMKFINKQPDAKTKVHELQDHCLATPGLFYTCQIDGFDLSVRACKALSTKLKG